MASVERISALLSSHSTFSASWPCRAAQVFSAMTATPCGTVMTSMTPAILRASASLTDFTVPPKRGGRHQHGASGGTGLAQLHPGIRRRGRTAGALDRPEEEIVVELGIGRGES